MSNTAINTLLMAAALAGDVKLPEHKGKPPKYPMTDDEIAEMRSFTKARDRKLFMRKIHAKYRSASDYNDQSRKETK